MDNAGVMEIDALIHRWRDLRVLVIGDVMLDEYRVGEVARVSPEAPVPVIRVDGVRQALGGAGNVACNIQSLGARCDLVGVIGNDAEGESLLGAMAEAELDSKGIIRSDSRPTTHKMRIVAGTQQMARLDRESTADLTERERMALDVVIEERLAGCDLVVLEDYDKGLFAGSLAHRVIRAAKAREVPVIADPKSELQRFRGAQLVKPNLAEALAFVGASEEEADIEVSLGARARVLEKLREQLGGGEIVMTRGSAGMTALDHEGGVFDVPTQPLAVYDVQGAGDTAVAALALARVAGASLAEACIVANAAASVAVKKVGTAAVSSEELRARWPNVRRAGVSDAARLGES